MPERLTLAFDTSAAHCAAALLSGQTVISEIFEQRATGQAERLVPLLEDLLGQNSVSWENISVIGVGTGPGNFTGIRISVAFARGLSLSLGVPAIGVGACEALATHLPRPCRIVIPGRRDMAIWQDFGDAPSFPQQDPTDALPPGPDAAKPAVTLAQGIGLLALARSQSPQPRPAPIYLRPADAAPGRDKSPLILP